MSHARVHRRQAISVNSQRRALIPVWIICSFLFTLIVAALLKQYLEDRPRRSDVAIESVQDGQDISISTASLSPGSIRLYAFTSSGQELRFLVQRTKENTVQVATATCRSCRRSPQPHYAHNGTFFCGQCRQAMHVETHDPGTHEGCSMPEIPHSESKGALLVRTSDVKAIFETFRQ